jgi:hypothetical protein
MGRRHWTRQFANLSAGYVLDTSIIYFNLPDKLKDFNGRRKGVHHTIQFILDTKIMATFLSRSGVFIGYLMADWTTRYIESIFTLTSILTPVLTTTQPTSTPYVPL